MGQRVRGRHGGEGPHRKQEAPFEVIVASAERQGEMDFAPLDEARRTHPALFDEMDGDARARFQVPGQEGREHALDHLRRAPDTQSPDIPAADRLRVLGQLTDPIEKLATPIHEAFSCAGQTDPASGALEESNTQLALEIVDLSPQRGLGDAQVRGGP